MQGLQTLLGLALGALGDGEVTGNEDHDLSVWINRVHAGFAALPTLLRFTGVDFKTMAITMTEARSFLHLRGQPALKMPVIEVLLGKALYWYIVPAFQLVFALVVADACMYCLHRLVHTNKWLYSGSKYSSDTPFIELTIVRACTLAASSTIRSIFMGWLVQSSF